MKKLILAILMAAFPLAVAAQTPPPAGAFEYSAGSWVAATTTATANPLPYAPPPVALYCFNGTTWVPADSTCFGGGGGGSGTVTSVSVVTANGVSGSVATATTTPAITLTLGAITPTSTNGVSAATMAFVDPTSSIQTQLNAKASSTATLTLGSTTLTLGGTTTTVAGLALTSPTVTTQAQNDNSTKAASTAYTDLAVSNAVAGVNPAVAVLAASTANVVGTYVQVGGGIGDTFTVTATGAFTLDGIAINAIGQRVLLKNQITASQNGVYTATVVGASLVSPVFTRALDYDTPSDVNNTGAIPVQSGTANALTSWLLTSQVTSIGSAGSALTYAQFSYNPTVIISGTPSIGYVPTATSSTTATWQAQSAGGTPLTFIQEGQYVFAAATSFTVTFPHAAQASGATLFMLISGDFGTFGAPSGWTTDFTQAAAISGLGLIHIASASQTSATFTSASAAPVVYLFEVSGTRTLDVKSTASTGSTNYSGPIAPPAITPTAGAAVFDVAATVLGASTGGVAAGPLLIHNLAPGWSTIDDYVQITNGARGLAGYMSTVAATAVSTNGPTITMTNAGPWFASSGVAYGTFSIK
jgi:hypothetical protein